MILGMAGTGAAELAEGLDVVERHREAAGMPSFLVHRLGLGQVQQRVE